MVLLSILFCMGTNMIMKSHAYIGIFISSIIGTFLQCTKNEEYLSLLGINIKECSSTSIQCKTNKYV